MKAKDKFKRMYDESVKASHYQTCQITLCGHLTRSTAVALMSESKLET